MKKNWSTILLVLILVVGLSLLLYPTVADWWNGMHASRVIASYDAVMAEMKEEDYTHLFDAAQAYNQELLEIDYPIINHDLVEGYNDLLNISGNGIMGYIEIPKINVKLPIYHGTSEGVLQIGVGHMEGTSLPIGGKSSHSVLSAHRGLPSSRLFTDLDDLFEGDVFILYVVDRTLTYEVDQILIVEPPTTDPLYVTEGEDYCTLVTCTPYGINSHRLLVRGHRIENLEAARTVRVTADAIQIEPILVAPFLAAPILLILLVVLLIPKKRRG